MFKFLDGAVPFPSDFAEYYRQKGYWLGQNLDQFFKISVARYPENSAIICQQQHISYQALDKLIDRCASGLYAKGLRAGDKAIVQLPNRHEFYVVFFALIRLGALPVMSLPGHRHAELCSFLRQTQATAYFCADLGPQKFDFRGQARICQQQSATLKHVFVLGEAQEFESLSDLLHSPVIAEAMQASPAAQIAFLQLSGGSTGVPKLIPRTHDDYLYSVRESAEICQLKSHSRLLMVLPAAHNFSMSSAGALGIFYTGGCVVLAADASPETAFSLMHQHQVTDVSLVPALIAPWLAYAERQQDDILSKLHCVQVGGARLSDAVAARLLTEFSVKLQQVFGMAEGLVHYTHLNMSHEQIIHTQGLKISADDEVLILDDDDQPVADGAIGHLLTRGPYTIRGYYRAEEHNANSFTPDGFYRTGDLVRLREDGCIVVEGRAKEQINRGGEKIATEEVEQAIMTHQRVALAALIAVPDDVMGEKSCLCVKWQVQEDDPSAIRLAMQLRQYLQQYGLATFKIPDRIEFLDQFPYTAFGKIDKKQLKTKFGVQPTALSV